MKILDNQKIVFWIILDSSPIVIDTLKWATKRLVIYFWIYNIMLKKIQSTNKFSDLKEISGIN